MHGGDLAPSMSYQLRYLLGSLSLSCSFSSGFSFGISFCFCCKSPVGKKGECKVEQVLEAEAHSWLLVGMLIKEVGVEHGMVLGVKALPK